MDSYEKALDQFKKDMSHMNGESCTCCQRALVSFRHTVSENIKLSLPSLQDKIESMKKQDAVLDPFNITGEYRLGELRGYNEALNAIQYFLTTEIA